MKAIRSYIKLLHLALLTVLLAGCTERMLEYRCGVNYSVTVDVVWTDGSTPDGAVFYFYPTDGSAPLVFYTPPAGFSGQLPVGEYNVLVFSSDSHNVGFRDMGDYAAAQIYANSLAGPPERLVQPGYINMGNRIAGRGTLVVPPSTNVHEKVNAYQMTRTFNITFIMEGEATAATGISGSFLGTSPYVDCSAATASADRVATDYTALPGTASTTFKTALTAFGYTLSPGTGDLYIDLEAGGQHYTATMDLTAEIQDIIDANGGALPMTVDLQITIDLRGVRVTATVTDWDFSNNTGSGVIV